MGRHSEREKVRSYPEQGQRPGHSAISQESHIKTTYVRGDGFRDNMTSAQIP